MRRRKAEVRVVHYPLGTQKQTKTMSVCFWESGDMSRLNDDATSSVNTTSLLNATPITNQKKILLYYCTRTYFFIPL
jgi:hypothetical protein